ncbi:FAD-dependent thymidylate synthase [Stutzerimonas stutzeri]|uniref:FAD-dependent thymidylate synthase n=1 Tax=Stutzerimonas stutzeri TaxID=316 RepID=UPI0008385BA0|nr:FAD-dependent thymidylate synthase [Stutzerimonas stutzeri]OCX57237.1 thymidylate synthase, flavin-dependent [Stutzerimonas stutzeri]
MKAEFISNMGSDGTVCDAARVSFDKAASNYTVDQNARLIKYLATHGHFTPFTHPQITLRYTVPIFVARQEFKHIVGFTRNEVSRRYVSDAPEFFTPEVWRSKPDGSVKQGSGGAHPRSDTVKEAYENLIDAMSTCYESMINIGVAPEQARMVLPQSMYTSYYVTGSLAAFARFYNQRSDSHAQVEIQQLAEQVNEIIAPLYPVSWAALTGK